MTRKTFSYLFIIYEYRLYQCFGICGIFFIGAFYIWNLSLTLKLSPIAAYPVIQSLNIKNRTLIYFM